MRDAVTAAPRRVQEIGVLLLLAALALIAGATLTPSAVSHTAGHTWWCLACDPRWLADAISNVALFIPLGVALLLLGVRVSRAVLIGSLLSLAVETSQAAGIPGGRTAELSDWLTNTAGAFAGAWVVAEHEWLYAPGKRFAQRLLACWTISLCGMFIATAWALSPADSSIGAASEVTPSALPNATGFGWFAAFADSATVNGVSIAHRGTGPVIASMWRTDTVRMRVDVRGHSDRRSTVPIVTVHEPQARSAHAFIGQRGSDAVVWSARKARLVGLLFPVLALRHVFLLRDRGDSVRSVRLTGMVSAGLLRMSAETLGENAPPGTAELSLTPALGWTVIQSVVRVDVPGSQAATLLWLMCWFTPGGLWLVRLRHRKTGGGSIMALVGGWCVLTLGTAAAAAWWFGIRPLAHWQTAVCLASACVGALTAWRFPAVGSTVKRT